MEIMINKIHNYISNKINISQHLYKKSVLSGICNFSIMFTFAIIYTSIVDMTDYPRTLRTRDFTTFVSIVLLGPLAENIILILYFKLTGLLLKYQYIFFILSSSILAGFAHPRFITGFVGFFIYSYQYVLCIRSFSTTKALVSISITHATHNAVTLGVIYLTQ